MQGIYEQKIANRAALNQIKWNLIYKMLGFNDQNLTDLISSCLEWLPAKRLTIDMIINHPFFSVI